MSSYAEVLGHRIVLDGTIGEVLYHLRIHRGQSQSGQCRRLRMGSYDFRRLENRPIPSVETFMTDVLVAARDCNVGEPQLLLNMLREGMALSGSSADEASRAMSDGRESKSVS